MKKTTLLLLLLGSICFSSQAQRRNMLSNADFETLNNGNLTDWSPNGNGIFPTDVNYGDIVVDGQTSLAVYGSGGIDSAYTKVSLNCPRFFTTNYGDQFKFKFTANLVGVASTTVNVVFQMNWGADVGYLFNDEVTLTQGTHEYTITSKRVGDVGTIPVSDRTLFSIQFGKVPIDAKVFVDDLELTNITNNWTGNIKTNWNFQHPTDLYEFWTFGSYSAALDKTDPANNIAKVTVNGATAYDCFTGRCFMWAENSNKHYQFEVTASASTPIDGNFIQAGNDQSLPVYLSSNFNLTTQKQTFVMDWPASAIPAAATYYLDMRFGATAPVGTVISIYEWKVNEVIDLTGISIVMPDNVASGATVPVTIWASPTDADNAVELTATSGTVSQVNGEWFFTSNGSASTLTATSKVNSAFTASKTVGVATAVNNPISENIVVYPTQVRSTLYIKGIESNATIDIYNNIGQLVRTAHHVTTLSVSDLIPGIYIANIKSGMATVARKFQVVK